MARTRYLKADFFDDEDLCALSPFHRLCYAGLWCQADKSGRLEDRPKRIKARIFPYDDIDMEMILTGLARAGFVIRYAVEGKGYIAIKPSAWKKHQRPRNDELESTIPEPGEGTIVYASLPTNERMDTTQTQHTQGDTKTVTESSLPRDEIVTTERILMGMGMGMGTGNGDRSTAEALTRSTALDDSPALLRFPTIGPQGQEWVFRKQQLDSWLSLYPGLDVLAEAQKALAWIQAHPGRRKTVGGMPRFLVGWFNRVVDRGGASSRDSSAGSGEKSKLSAALERASNW